MAQLLSSQIIIAAIILIVPGFIIVNTQRRFVTGRHTHTVDYLIEYFVYGFMNFAIVIFPVYLFMPIRIDDYADLLVWLFVIFIAPFLIGLVAAIFIQQELVERLFRSRHLRFFGLKPVHHVPSVWDWKFSKMGGEWVIVTMKDDTVFYGWFGSSSFSSSNENERDIYIQQVFDRGADGKWVPTAKALLIASGEVKTIEFMKPAREEIGADA